VALGVPSQDLIVDKSCTGDTPVPWHSTWL